MTGRVVATSTRPRYLDVWAVELDKIRPVLILTRDPIAGRIDRVVVAPITSTDRGLRSHFPLGRLEGLRVDSVANLDATTNIDRHALRRKVGSVPLHRREQFCHCLSIAFGCSP